MQQSSVVSLRAREDRLGRRKERAAGSELGPGARRHLPGSRRGQRALRQSVSGRTLASSSSSPSPSPLSQPLPVASEVLAAGRRPARPRVDELCLTFAKASETSLAPVSPQP